MAVTRHLAVCGLAFLSGLMMLGGAAWAQAQPLVFGVAEDRRPLSFRTEAGAWAGLEIELSQALAAMLDRAPMVAAIPEAAELAVLDSGQIDALMTLGPALAAPDVDALRVEPAYAELSIMLLPARGAPLENPDLALCSFADQISAAVLSKLTGRLVLDHASVDTLLISMADGDCGAIGVPVAELPPVRVATGLEVDLAEVRSQPLHLLVRKEDRALAASLSHALRELAANGTLDALAERWGLRVVPIDKP